MKREKNILLPVFTIFLFIVCFSPLIALDIQVNLNYGSYTKTDEVYREIYGKNMSAPGFGASLFLSKYFGLFLDFSFVSAEGFSTYFERPLSYKETHFGLGLLGRYPIYRFAPDKGLHAFIKGGTILLTYAETMDEKIGSTIPGLCFGGGIVFHWKQWGAEVEWLRNFAYEQIEIQGLDITEKINFSGTRFSLKAIYRF